MTSYADKPWLKSYKIGAFKLKTTIDYPVKPLRDEHLWVELTSILAA